MRRKVSSGYGKKFEARVHEDLSTRSVPFTFEGASIKYTLSATYKPDVVFDSGMCVEIKTFLPYEEQRKLRAVKLDNPDLDLRIIFEKPDKKLPNSKLTHGEWATKYGFVWSTFPIPEEWYK